MTIWHVSISEMKYQTFAMYLISSNEWRIMYWYNLCQLSSEVSILILYATRDSCAVTYPVLSQSQLFFFFLIVLFFLICCLFSTAVVMEKLIYEFALDSICERHASVWHAQV